MNWVSRHILLAPFMCLFLLFACGSHDNTIWSKHFLQFLFIQYDTRKPSDSLTGKPPLLADGHVEGDFSKNKRKETAIKDSTEVKADKETTSNTREENRSETIKEKKESTLPEQIGFACVCVTVLIVVMLIVKHWRNRQSSS